MPACSRSLISSLDSTKMLTLIATAPHLDAMLGRLADGVEVRHDEGHQVRAHFYRGGKVILKHISG